MTVPEGCVEAPEYRTYTRPNVQVTVYMSGASATLSILATPFEGISKSSTQPVKVGHSNGIRHVGVVVSVAAQDRVDLKESAEEAGVLAGAHFDQWGEPA
jgi:hypothetical protein